MFPVVILAGGLASRLGPLTKNLPKAMLLINGKPFIYWQLKLLRSQNITEVIICIGHLGHIIKEYVGDGELWSLKVGYSEDGSTPLLTGGAIKKALNLLGDKFFVIYGDSYLPVDFMGIAHAMLGSKKSNLMTIFNNKGFLDGSNILYTGLDKMYYNKKRNSSQYNYIDYGLSIISSHSLESFCNSDKFDLSDFFEYESNRNNIEPYEVFSRYYEIGSIQGILDFEEYISKNNVDMQ